MPRSKLELVPGTLDMLVLQTLTLGAMHGYGIVRHIQARSENVLSVEEGSLYPALHRMQRRGLIVAEWGASESNRRAKFYSLTKAGRAELEERRASWKQVSGAIAEVLRACEGGGTA